MREVDAGLETLGESDFVFEGCYTTHGDIKRENRAGENLLSTMDTLTAMSYNFV